MIEAEETETRDETRESAQMWADNANEEDSLLVRLGQMNPEVAAEYKERRQAWVDSL